MLIDVTQVFKSIDGKVIRDKDSDGKLVDATLKMVIVNAVLGGSDKDSGMDKVKKFTLAKKVFNGDKVDLSAEEITLIKKMIGESFAPLIVGQSFEMLEGHS